MRLNVYTEELLSEDSDQPIADVVHADYISSRTGQPMRNWGIRIYLKSHPDLHYIPGRDDDRSAITFWCGAKEKNIFLFWELIRERAYAMTLDTWRDKLKELETQEQKL